MNTKIHFRPGESEKVVARITRGTRVEVLARRGRWIKVRVGKKRGWLTRTTVRQRPVSVSGERQRRWSQDEARRQRWKRKRQVRRTQPARAPKRVATTTRAAEDIADTPAKPAPAADETPSVTKPLPQVGPRGVFVSARAGMKTLAMDFTSDGQSGIGNYAIRTRAAAMQLSAGAETAVGPLRVAAEANYRFSNAAPGIHYEASSGASGDMAFMAHEVDATVSAGARLSRSLGGVVGVARAGYTYSVLLFDQVDNVGMLPSEDLRGAIVGGEIIAPRAWPKTAVRARFDVLVSGQRGQTAGLEDGDSSAASSTWFTAQVTRAMRGAMSLELVYRYQSAHTDWTGPSMRQADALEAARSDTAHTLVLGLVGTL